LDSGSLVSDGSGTGISPVCRLDDSHGRDAPCHYRGSQADSTGFFGDIVRD